MADKPRQSKPQAEDVPLGSGLVEKMKRLLQRRQSDLDEIIDAQSGARNPRHR